METKNQNGQEQSRKTLAKLRELTEASERERQAERDELPSELKRVAELLEVLGHDVAVLPFLDPIFHRLLDHIKPFWFPQVECVWVWAALQCYRESHGTVPTPSITRDLLLHGEGGLTEDDPYEEILALLEREPCHTTQAYARETTDAAFALHERRIHYTEQLEAALNAAQCGELDQCREIAQKALTTEPTAKDAYQWVSPLEIQTIAEQERCWLVEGILESNKTFVIGGPQKAFKTAILCDLVISLATGTDFLGKFPVPTATTVAFVSAESDETDILPRYESVAKSKGFALADLPAERIRTIFAAPQLANPAEVRALAVSAKEQGASVLIIDPMYLTLLRGGETKINAGNRFEMGEVLALLRDICREHGLTPILCHHNNKHTSGKMELNDLSYTGLAEFARQSIMVQPKTSRTPEGESLIQMRTHGFARGRVYDLCINEGTWPDDIIWDVQVQEAKEVAAEEKRTKADQDVDRLRDAMQSLAEGRGEPLDTWFTKTELRNAMSCSASKIQTVLIHAIAEGFVEATQEGTRQARYRRIK